MKSIFFVIETKTTPHEIYLCGAKTDETILLAFARTMGLNYAHDYERGVIITDQEELQGSVIVDGTIKCYSVAQLEKSADALFGEEASDLTWIKDRLCEVRTETLR